MTALIHKAANSFAFGPFLLIPEQQLLLENGEPVRIGGRAFDLLTALVERQGEVLSKKELLSRAWPGVFVEEGSLKVNIAALRRILGEEPSPARYIETVTGSGYRFIATVRTAAHRPRILHPASSRRAGNLPLPTKRIFGREDVIASILFDLEQARLVSIVGPGGIGKTTVALAIADRAAAAFAGGAWLVDLSLLEDPSRVPEAIDAAISASAGAHDKTSDILLLLDNCEHLIGAVAHCADQVLTNTRNVKLLATSREPLCIRGERVRRLHGLDMPPVAGDIKAADALAFPAVQLFANRTAEKLKSFRLDDTNAAIVTAICHRVDGHALAIERLAQRVGALGIKGLLDHLDRRFHMFDGYHDGPERHRTLTAAVQTSYAILSPSEQTLMRRLSTFAGAFSLEAACTVGGAQDVARAQVIEDIASLVAKSLLSAELCDGEMQYRQAQVTRAFATEKLIEHGELEDTLRRHAKTEEKKDGDD